MRWQWRAVSVTAVMGLALAACSSTPVGAPPTSRAFGADSASGATSDAPRLVDAGHALAGFDACEDFLDHVISHAVELVGPYGLGAGPVFPFGIEEATDDAEVAQAGNGRFSGTNVQVGGVDEPDTTKTDGKRIVTLVDQTLVVVDVTGQEPRESGRLILEGLAAESLFLWGDTVLVFGTVHAIGPLPLVEPGRAFGPVAESPTLHVTEVDISGEPEVVSSMAIDGRVVSGRMVGDTVRLVTSSGPIGFEWSFPEGSGLRAEREAVEKNREIVRSSGPENWIPYFIVTGADGEVVDEGTLFPCDRARHPEEFSGLEMLSVVTIDLSRGLAPVDATGVLAVGETVYASGDALFVATQNWQMRAWAGRDAEHPEKLGTDIHGFDISTQVTEYLASGRVDGYLLNQFAMDLHDGFLRVATTTSPPWWGGDADSESMVTVLAREGGSLAEVGRVDGLGPTERIYSVRFMGDTGYVVTFRQVDPLYTLDLSNPRDPEVAGELKILGYSAYLHPLGGDLLLGVGQEAGETGIVEGTQVSVFDVGDPANPRRVDQHVLAEGSSSQVEYDHHAFLYWDPQRLAVVPIQQWTWEEEGEKGFMGAVALRIGEDGSLQELERIIHTGGHGPNPDWHSQITRSLVIDDALYTISRRGVLKSDLGSLAEEAWLGF